MKNLDWSNLPFGYIKTNYNVRSFFKDNNWSEPVLEESENINIHISASCLHYGQEAFEGLKAFKGKDGKIRLFRIRENALRLKSSCKGILMEDVPIDLFEKMVIMSVKNNIEFVPPYDSGSSLYIRPLVIGLTPIIGVNPSSDYALIIFVTPVGPYFKEGFKPSPIAILREYDRVAPLGTGRYKIGGNYAASLIAIKKAHDLGYSTVLYLDSKEKKYIDECGPANFFAIKDNTYITPKSDSILQSITNKSLMQIAKDFGMSVEQRQIEPSELSSFDEAGACGTAAVISPISRIDDIDKNVSYVFSKDGKPGPISEKLYNRLRAIQYGDEPDIHNWITILE